jgi:hypothetical protein
MIMFWCWCFAPLLAVVLLLAVLAEKIPNIFKYFKVRGAEARARKAIPKAKLYKSRK